LTSVLLSSEVDGRTRRQITSHKPLSDY